VLPDWSAPSAPESAFAFPVHATALSDETDLWLSESPPASSASETRSPPANAAPNEVWVNTRSGKYWKPGSRYCGKTKEGEFMSELDALDRGYSPAGGTGQ